jgi:CshA-type fibril repeat protein
VTLLNAASMPATTVANANGSYTIDPLTGTITFTPVGGFVGSAAPVTFQTTDMYAQSAASTYTPTVRPPAPTPIQGLTTNAGQGVTQSTTVSVPAGGTISLLDATNTPVTVVVVPGAGTFALDTLTGIITFVPTAGFSGTTAVPVRVTDQYSQPVDTTYSATVQPVVTPPVVPPPVVPPVTPPGGIHGTADAPAHLVLSSATSTVPVTCTLRGASLAQCTVTLWATVSGRQVVVGTGTASTSRSNASSITVKVTLTPLGRALAAQPGGLHAIVAAAITPRGSRTVVKVKDTTTLVAHTFILPRPVLFDTASAEIRPAEAVYLNGLRHHLDGVKAITCVGYTDSVDTSARNLSLGAARAVTVCAYLVRGTHIRILNATKGESAPQATNATADGRQRNRRTTIGFTY